MPTLPLFKIRIASVAPLFPTWKRISAPAAPTPLVLRSASVEVVPVPPMRRGPVAEVTMVGVVNDILVPAIPLGSVLLMLGTPAPEVISTPLLAVARPVITLVADEYSN